MREPWYDDPYEYGEADEIKPGDAGTYEYDITEEEHADMMDPTGYLREENARAAAYIGDADNYDEEGRLFGKDDPFPGF